MKVGVGQAKTKLSQLIDQVLETGEPVTITRNGVPVAMLVRHRERLGAQQGIVTAEALNAAFQARSEPATHSDTPKPPAPAQPRGLTLAQLMAATR